jgi:hypothetical protein
MTSDKLRQFVVANMDLLALNPDDALSNDPRVQSRPNDEPRFVPLADVPDNVWKSNVNFTFAEQADGSKKRQPGPGARGKDDNPNHFADLDLSYGDDKKTFLELNLSEPEKYLKPSEWVRYYAAQKPLYAQWAALLGVPDKTKHWGSLPFRVHQLFDIMVSALKAERTSRDGSGLPMFLSAGGVLIHYMGDACQPLHTSYLSQGDPAQVMPRPRADKMMLVADGVHSGYEDEMVAYGYQNEKLAELLDAEIQRQKSDAEELVRSIASGYEASKRVIELIAKTQAQIAPRDIVDKWVELKGQSRADKAAAMWREFGARTVSCMARGTRYLAAIWQAAWTQGEGDDLAGFNQKIDEARIMAIYNDASKMPSIALDRYPDTPNVDWSNLEAQEELQAQLGRRQLKRRQRQR